MLRNLEAVIDEEGNVHLLEPISLPTVRRALVTILDSEPVGAIPHAAIISFILSLKLW